MQQSTRLQREGLASLRPPPPCCEGEAFVQPGILGTACPVVACDRDLIGAPVGLDLDGADGLDGLGGLDGVAGVAARGPDLEHARDADAWESAESASRCARGTWESAGIAPACTYEDAWEPAEADMAVDEPPCCTGTGEPRGPEAPCAPLRPEVLKGYFPLVRKLVRQVSRNLPPNVQRDDLLSAGLLGLVDSLRKNGGSDGETFAGYAKLRIRGAIVDELRAQDWLSRRAREAVEAGAAAGKSCGTTVFVSLSEVTPTEESAHLSGGDDPIEAISARATRQALAFAIAQLPERERRVIGMYYFEGAKLKDIGAELGVGEPRVSQLHTRALGMLRGMLSHA